MARRLVALFSCFCLALLVVLAPALSGGAPPEDDEEGEAPGEGDDEAPAAGEEEEAPGEDDEAPAGEAAEDDEAEGAGESEAGGSAAEAGDADESDDAAEAAESAGEDTDDDTDAGADADDDAGAEAGEPADDDEPEGAQLEAFGEGEYTDEELERAVAGLDQDELLGFDGEPVDRQLAAMLAEDFDGPLTDEQEAAVLGSWDEVEGVEFDDELRAEFQGLPPEQFEALAEISPKELSAATELTPAFTEQLMAQASAMANLSPEAIDALTKLFIQALRKKLATVREEVLARTIESVREKQSAKLGKIMMLLVGLSPLGLLLLFAPLVLKKQYPNQMPTLVRASALASVAFIGAMLMFTGLLFLLRVIQNEAAMATNPQIRVIEASFDAVDKNLEEVAAMPGLIEVPLQRLRDGEADSLGVALLENVKAFKSDFEAFDGVAEMFKSVNWLFGWVSIAMLLLTVVLFLVTLRPLLTDIIKMPGRAAQGEVAPGEVVGLVGKRVGNELLATLGVSALAVIVSLLSGYIEARLVGPAMDQFILQLLIAMQYVFVEPLASTAYVYVAMGSVLAFLVFNIAVVVIAGVLFIRMAQKILRARFHDKVPLATHKQFWIWGSAGLLWALLLPYLVLQAVLPFSRWVIESGTTGEFSWGRVLVAGPLTLALGFVILFVVGQGLRGLIFMVKYKLAKPAEPAAAEPAPA